MQSAGTFPIEFSKMVDFPIMQTDLLRTAAVKWPSIHVGRTMEGGISVIYIPEERVETVFSSIDATYMTLRPILCGLMGVIGDIDSGETQVREHQALRLEGNNVIIGIVDTGIDYTLDIFQKKDKTTRIKNIWDQSIVGEPPDGFGYGAEFDERQINAALQSQNPREIVPHEDIVGHGTFLASVAAARNADYVGVAPSATIIAVKLRKAHPYHLKKSFTPDNEDNVFSESDIMMGVDYILCKAKQYSMPVSICLGLGSNQSSHMGVLPLDQFLEHVGLQTGVAVCVASGNEALAHHHASATIPSPGEQVDVLLDCKTDMVNFYMEIWNRQPDRMSVSVTSPNGESIARVPAKHGTSYKGRLATISSEIDVAYFSPTPRTGSQYTLIQVINPIAGIWTITVYGDTVLEGAFDIWLPVTGVGSTYVKFVDGDSNATVTEPGAARGVITVGAYEVMERRIYPYSSWGPTRTPALAPDLCAPGENVSGYFPSGLGKMSGSSISAAITASACALLLEWGIVDKRDLAMNTNRIKTFLIRGCRHDVDTRFPNERWGYGRMDIFNSFMQML